MWQTILPLFVLRLRGLRGVLSLIVDSKKEVEESISLHLEVSLIVNYSLLGFLSYTLPRALKGVSALVEALYLDQAL
jgi:carbamoylphosphate synthase large subunit